VMLRAAALLGHRIGMTVPSDESQTAHEDQVRSLGLSGHVIGIEPVRKPLGEYAKQDPAAMTDALVDAAQRLVERGADVICPSGLAYIPVRVSAREVAERVGVLVLDPALLSVRTVEMLVLARSVRDGPLPREQSKHATPEWAAVPGDGGRGPGGERVV
jgi:Asp/Glu/hydantoin racemase